MQTAGRLQDRRSQTHEGSLAFPAISTGIYGYPIEEAAHIAVSTVRHSLREQTTLDEIIFCCFSAGDLAVYERVLSA